MLHNIKFTSVTTVQVQFTRNITEFQERNFIGRGKEVVEEEENRREESKQSGRGEGGILKLVNFSCSFC